MKSIYILEFADSGNYCAYATFDKAKQVLWECYCDEVDAEIRARHYEEDIKTLGTKIHLLPRFFNSVIL
jgi:hypothetical protein